MKGLIGFIDILGYQSFLENNSAEESALRVLDLINGIPKSVKIEQEQNWPKIFQGNLASSAYTKIRDVEHIIFSDTIVLLLPYEDKSGMGSAPEFIYFTFFATTLMAKLFENGLPSRGVIHEGEYVSKDACLAGKGIVEAYRICSQLDFSGIVLSKICAKLVAEKFSEWENIFVEYLSPLKGDTEERMICPNWYARLSRRDECDRDLIQFVSEAFWAHRKDLPLNTDSKIRNTCKLLRRFRLALKDSVAERKKISGGKNKKIKKKRLKY